MSPPLVAQGMDPELQPLPRTMPSCAIVGTLLGWRALPFCRVVVPLHCVTLGKSHQLHPSFLSQGGGKISRNKGYRYPWGTRSPCKDKA